MPQIPPGRMTFGEIRRFGLSKAGNRAIVTDANVWLCQLLYELYTSWAWPFLYRQTFITFNGPTFTLPSDFLQSWDDNGQQILVFDGQQIGPPLAFILETDPFTFTSANLPQTAGGMPRRWYADRGQGLGFLWPNPLGHLGTMLFRYKYLPAQETVPPPAGTPTLNDAIIPAYPYALNLVNGLATLAMEYEQDPNAGAMRASWTQELQMIRANAMPLRAQDQTIPLEPEVFGQPFTED